MPSVVLLSLCKEDVAPGVDLVLSGAAREVPLSSAESCFYRQIWITCCLSTLRVENSIILRRSWMVGVPVSRRRAPCVCDIFV